MISAVCTVAMPDGTLKRIKQLHVFYTTAAWSMFAYIWMLVVYLWWVWWWCVHPTTLYTLCTCLGGGVYTSGRA